MVRSQRNGCDVRVVQPVAATTAGGHAYGAT
jgi:hypothetical protein